MNSFLKRSILIALASAALGANAISVTVTGEMPPCDHTCYDVTDPYWNGDPGNDEGDYGDGGDGSGGSSGEGEEELTCRPTTANGVDAMSDALAVKAAALIKAKSDYKDREYGAIIYRDSGGTIRMSVLVRGTATSTVFNFTTLGITRSRVVGVVHNHPTNVYDGSPQEAQINLNPSSNDWATADSLVAAGVDTMVLQLYVVGTDSRLREYPHYAKSQYTPRHTHAGYGVHPGATLPSTLVAPVCP